MPKVATLTLILALSTATRGAEIVLRPVANPSGNVVTLGDVADVRATDADRAHRLASIPLIPAPAPGTSQFIRRQQIEEMLVAQGEDLAAHRISGAEQIRIGKASRKRSAAVRTSPKRLTTETTRQLHDAVHEAILDNLRIYAAANEPWTIRFELITAQLRRLAAASTPITASGGLPPWTGPQRFTLRFTTPDGPITTPVVAEVSLPDPVVVATRAISSGMILHASDVAIERIPSKPGRSRGFEPMIQLEDVVGMEAIRPIQAGQTLGRSMVRQPIIVRRGETVTVYARTGGVQVRTTARAREDGGRGDLIVVETLPERERFAAHVVGPREVSVFAQGIDASAYGDATRQTSAQNNRRRRAKILDQRDAERTAVQSPRNHLDRTPPDRTAANPNAGDRTTELLKWQAHRRRPASPARQAGPSRSRLPDGTWQN